MSVTGRIKVLTEAPLPEVVARLEVTHSTEHPHGLVVNHRRVGVSRSRPLLLCTLTVPQVPHLLLCKSTNIKVTFRKVTKC